MQNDDDLSELVSLIFSSHKIRETNANYRRHPIRWILKFKEHQVKFHLGSDAHPLEEIGDFSRVSD
jgi:putative hydrolase